MTSSVVVDSYVGVHVTLSTGRELVIHPLTVADGLRLMGLSELSGEGATWAGAWIAHELPVMLGLDLEGLTAEDLSAIYSRVFDPKNWTSSTSSSEDEPAEESEIKYTTTDILADYAATYGGPPRPSDPWPLFIALLSRTGRFDSRERLRLFDSIGGAISAAFSEDQRRADLARDELLRGAYPIDRTGPRMALVGGKDRFWIEQEHSDPQPTGA